MKKIALIVLIMSSISELKAESIKYKLTFPEAQAHYVDVEMELSGFKERELELKLPVWTPGSYLVREFARHVESVQAIANNSNIKIEKTNKNTWRVNNSSTNLKIRYRVYAFELTVRTSFIDESHASLNGSNIFMYVEGYKNLKSEVNIIPRENWEKISCGLPYDKNNPFKIYADDYDILADSPIEIGNQDIIEFEALGIPHSVAMVGPGSYDREKSKRILSKLLKLQIQCLAKIL